MTQRLGVFGGTFDPIHIGHLAGAECARASLRLDRILFVPNARPPHKRNQTVTPPDDRVEMVRLAIAGNPHFALSLIEVERGGLSYTLDTMRSLRDKLPPGTTMMFLTGWEAVNELHTWHCPDQLLDEFEIGLINRPIGHDVDWTAAEERFPLVRQRVRVVEAPRLELSSREIRRRVAAGLPIRYLVPEPVRRFIEDRGLYTATAAGTTTPDL